MARRYQYRVVTSAGAVTGNPTWSEKDARAFAKYAVSAGSRSACVDRAVKFPGGRRGEWTRRGCVRGRHA